MRVTIWICPSFGCGNYYASSNAGDLAAEFNTNARHEPTYARARCADCARQGRDVKRIPLEFEDGLDTMRSDDLDRRMAEKDKAREEAAS